MSEEQSVPVETPIAPTAADVEVASKAPVTETTVLQRVLRLLEKVPGDAAQRIAAYAHHKHGSRA